ncbi:hypothetical protein BJY01DRAFT_243142 [Aspergillus pseudoustus]|uniref:Uncharacterized protein n=1 Tax=Aspergillus pseudoustus TaxID=1810923 RepID=A0ABR4KVZ3_9EURO
MSHCANPEPLFSSRWYYRFLKVEPIAAISLVVSIITLVDFGVKVVEIAREVHDSAEGATADNKELDEMAKRFEKTGLELERSQDSPGTRGQDPSLAMLIEKCIGTSQERRAMLEGLKARRNRDIILQPFRIRWNKDKVTALEKELQKHQQELQLFLVSDNFTKSRASFDELVSLAKSSEEKLVALQHIVEALKQIDEMKLTQHEKTPY